MKCIVLALATLVLFNTAGFSQKGGRVVQPADNDLKVNLTKLPKFIFNLHGGYAIGLGSTFKFYPDDVRSIKVEMLQNSAPTKTTSYEATKKGLGEGFRAGGGLSYIVNDYINVGLDFDYFQSTISRTRDSSFRQTQLMTSGNVDETLYNQNFTISYNAVLLTFTPNVTFKAISRPKFYIYNKIGAVITFRPNSKQTETTSETFRQGWQGFYRDSAANTSRVYDWGIHNPSVGFMGSIGAQFKVTETVRVFAEAQYSHIVFAVRNRVLTKYMSNGKNILSTLPLNQREVDFESSFSQSDTNVNPNQPSRAVTQRIPISYVGFQAGIAYRF